MPNKLKRIFSKDDILYEGNIKFENEQYKEEFKAALNSVWKDEKKETISGISTISINAVDKEIHIPLLSEKNIKQAVICLAQEDVTFDLNTLIGKRKIKFQRHKIDHQIVLETYPNEIISYKIIIPKQTIEDANTIAEHKSFKCEITYNIKVTLAKTVEDIMESFYIGIAFFSKFHDGKNSPFIDIINSFTKMASFFKKITFMEKTFQWQFKPSLIKLDIKERELLEELYVLLVNKQALKLNAKLCSTKDTSIKLKNLNSEIKKQSKLDITMSWENDYSVWGQNISLYLVGFVSNAIVKDIRKDSNNENVILYGDVDSNPMYISYKGFLDKSMSINESEIIMQKKDEYMNALTITEHMKNI